MPKDEMTERILRALDDPYVTFLGHLTGRKLLSRDGYSVDFDRIFEKAGAARRDDRDQRQSQPPRPRLAPHPPRPRPRRRASASIPTRTRSASTTRVISGTWVARKAGLTPKEIFNTKPVEEVAEYLKTRRG